jgi:hypothetical protein
MSGPAAETHQKLHSPGEPRLGGHRQGERRGDELGDLRFRAQRALFREIEP